MCMCVRACVSVCLSVCLSVVSHISETRKAIAITFKTVTASVTRMHHVFMTLTLTFIQGHTDLNHDNTKCVIISDTVQAMPIKFAVKVGSPTKGLYDSCQPDQFDLHSRSQVRLKLYCFLICSISDNTI